MSGSLPFEQVRAAQTAGMGNNDRGSQTVPQLNGIAVTGLGYWGPNWVRNLHQLRCARRMVACDFDAGRREHIAALYPGVATTARFEEVLDDGELEAVVIATPVSTHYQLARKALEAGKSVLVEKPLAMSCRESAELVRIAREQARTLMVGHTFLYSAPVLKIRELIDDGELGEVLYIGSTRANLGLFQHDVNVAWDLAAHDISIILTLIGRMPDAVSCQGQSHYGQGVEDVALLTLHFPGNVIAFVHVSWLDPNKIRRTTIVGSRKMLVYDDTLPQEKVRVYDRGVNVHRYYDTYGEFHFSYRYGDIQIPRIEESEPLRVECQHFVECVRDGTTPLTDGLDGLRVVSVLEAANLSLRERGQTVPVDRAALASGGQRDAS
jgi:predicted dehydrogenase